MIKKTGKQRLITAASAAALSIALSTASVAQAQNKVEFDIAEQPLSTALLEYSDATGAVVMAPADLTRGKRAPAVRGDLEPSEALSRILNGSGLKYQQADNGVFTVTLARASLGEGSARAFQLAQLQGQSTNESVASIREVDEDDDENVPDTVVVTGTRIKDVNDQFSPIIQLNRSDIDAQGLRNFSDVLATLPQNFNGGTSLSTQNGASSAGSGSVGINLRGLGNEATLVLLNGRRLAPGGGFGSFVDVSTIPAVAVDRVEIIADGASAIYGSDAVAGVVNILTRTDFEGAETRLTLGSQAGGESNNLQIAQTVGVRGTNGGGLISYQYSSDDGLDSKDREFSESLPETTLLLPFSEKHSVYASGDYEFSSRLRGSVDAFYNDRSSRTTTSFQSSSLSTTAQTSSVEQLGFAGGLDFDISSDWLLEFDATYSESTFRADNEFVFAPPGTSISFDSDTSVFTLDGSVSGPIFNFTDESVRVFVGGHFRTEEASLSSVFSPIGFTITDANGSRDVSAVSGELYAPVVTENDNVPFLSRLAFSASARYEEYSDAGSSFDPRFGVVLSPIEGLNLRATYGTSFRAPRIDQLIETGTNLILNRFVDPSSPQGETLALRVDSTTNVNLEPENAETYTLGFDLEPKLVPGLSFRGTYFNIEYDDRIARPRLISDSADNFARWISFSGVPQRGVTQSDIQELVDNAGLIQRTSDRFPELPPVSVGRRNLNFRYTPPKPQCDFGRGL